MTLRIITSLGKLKALPICPNGSQISAYKINNESSVTNVLYMFIHLNTINGGGKHRIFYCKFTKMK